MVIQGGSFKGKSGDLKPKEVVSLLLDDEEIEQSVKVKMEEADDEKKVDIVVEKKPKKRDGGAINKENGRKKLKQELAVEGVENHVDSVGDPQSLFDLLNVNRF